MHGTYLIEVANKPGRVDTLAHAVLDDLKHAGIKAPYKVVTSKLYRLIGQLSQEERARVGEELLSDPVVEEAHEGGWKPKEVLAGKTSKKMARPPASVVVDVWFKQGVTDTVGESVLKGLHDMKLEEIADVRTGMRYRFIGLKNPQVADKFAVAVLMNPLIQERNVHVD